MPWFIATRAFVAKNGSPARYFSTEKPCFFDVASPQMERQIARGELKTVPAPAESQIETPPPGQIEETEHETRADEPAALTIQKQKRGRKNAKSNSV